MKIIAQTLKDGSVRLLEAPAPLLSPGCIRVRTLYSSISPGTEGTKIVTGKKSLLGKAKAKPDQVKQVLQMVEQVGLKSTYQKVKDKLEGASPLGYSLAGKVVEVAPGVEKVRPGDIVACAGAGANHASEVVVPVNLVAKVPDGVSADQAAMTTLASIALQGIRLAEPTLGENAVVIGLGAIGLMTCQLLRANGCRVYAADVSEAAVEFARATGSAKEVGRLGTDSVEARIQDFTRGAGADLVLICAGTPSSEPVSMAGRISRKRGRVIVVGAVGMDLPRPDYYEKEIRFSVSCSYGPGRYDPAYEEGGQDYPYGFVRWTEGRNMEAALDLMAGGDFDPLPLVTHRFSLDRATDAYQMIAERSEPFCGILVEYDPDENVGSSGPVEFGRTKKSGDAIGIGFAGAGSFAQSFLLPTFRDDSRTTLGPIFTQSGLTAADVGQRQGFARAVESADAVLNDESTDAVVIATRHDQHGPLVLDALEAGKHIFVEKPLCLTLEQLKAIRNKAADLSNDGKLPVIQVGFNRRFSPGALEIKKLLGSDPGPLNMMYRISAGRIPKGHWTQDPIAGGGRIVGEVCHFIDLMQFICGSHPVRVSAMTMVTDNQEVTAADNLVVNLGFANGSVGSIGYFAEGAASIPKEQFEVLGSDRGAVLHNFQKVTSFKGRKKSTKRCGGKGHREEVLAFLDGIRKGEAPIGLESQLITTLTTFKILDAIGSGQTERVDLADLESTDE